jgi:hypothetical protein
VAPFQIITERENASGWSYQVQTAAGNSPEPRRFTMQLSWADYNHWSSTGSDPPQRVAEAVLRFVLSHLDPTELPDQFDASLARRRFDDADQLIPRLIRQ